MKRLLALACGAAALIAGGAANAADLPARPAPPRAPVFVAPVYNWTGFYIGINGGGAWAHKCWDFLGVGAVLAREGCHDPDGGLFGGQVGFNWQTGAFVFGVEFAGDWASLEGNNRSLVFPLETNRSKIDAIASFTGRVGYAWDAALLYVKGGGAWVDDKYDARITTTGILVDSASGSRGGWTVGGGFEYGFAPNWSVGVEYMHYDFGNRNVTFAPAACIGGACVDRISQTVDAVTARLNWRFGWGGPVVARY
jgi:outer membrane immunogenic protein